MKDINTWTVFSLRRKDPETKNWKSEVFFMMGPAESFSGIDFETDWRFCEVKDKRTQSVLLGDIDLSDKNDWPIKFPLILKNGAVTDNNFWEEENKLKIQKKDDFIKKIKVA